MRPLESLTDISIFAACVEQGSLSAAGRGLGLSLAVVSKRLARLEARLGTRLLNRTTRRLSLTDEGAVFLERCRRILVDVAEAEASVQARKGAVEGLLRVTCTAAFGRRQIAPRLAALAELYPRLRVQVIVTDAVLDLVKEGIDVAIRQASLPDSSLIMRQLAPNRRVLCAAPAYLARFGVPLAPADLLRHRVILMGDPAPTAIRLDPVGGGEQVAIPLDAAVIANDGEVAHAAALAGAGIVLKSIWDVAEDIDAGRLVPLLGDWRAPAAAIQAVYPSSRLLAPRVRVFIDFMAAALGAAWCWS